MVWHGSADGGRRQLQCASAARFGEGSGKTPHLLISRPTDSLTVGSGFDRLACERRFSLLGSNSRQMARLHLAHCPTCISDDMINHEQEFNHPLMSHRKAEFEAWSRIVHHEHPQRLRWLDIGCGCGSLVRHVHRLGQDEIFGSDTGVWAEKAREAGLPIIPEEQLDRYRGQFDLLTAIDVIEHVVEPVDVLRR
jgi:hypothetical protein